MNKVIFLRDAFTLHLQQQQCRDIDPKKGLGLYQATKTTPLRSLSWGFVLSTTTQYRVPTLYEASNKFLKPIE